jgi:hypothetical protein
VSNLDRDGRSALHRAAAGADVEAAIVRLAAGDDPDLGDRRGFTLCTLPRRRAHWMSRVSSSTTVRRSIRSTPTATRRSSALSSTPEAKAD